MKQTGEMRNDNGNPESPECATTPKKNTSTEKHPTHPPSSSRVLATDFQSILRANSAFYSAFDSLDLTAMEDVWIADSNACFCKFPGSRKLIGTTKIMRSWKLAVEKMSGSLRRNWMEPREIQVEFRSKDSAVIFCEELIYAVTSSVVNGQLRPKSSLIQKYVATNGFKKVKGKWKMWFHEASIPHKSRVVQSSEQASVTEESSWQASELTSPTMEEQDAVTVTTADVNKKTWACGVQTEKCKCNDS